MKNNMKETAAVRPRRLRYTEGSREKSGTRSTNYVWRFIRRGVRSVCVWCVVCGVHTGLIVHIDGTRHMFDVEGTLKIHTWYM